MLSTENLWESRETGNLYIRFDEGEGGTIPLLYSTVSAFNFFNSLSVVKSADEGLVVVAVDFDILEGADEVIGAFEEDFAPAACAAFEVGVFFGIAAFDEDFDGGV